MSVLTNSKHEHFAQAVAKGVSATKAYVAAGYSAKGAAQSAARMLTNADICSRLAELHLTLAAGTIALEISSRNARVQALQDRWDRMRTGLNLLLTERGAVMSETAGGASGLLMVDYKGKESMPVYRVDTGVVSLMTELRAHERQAAEELEQWKIRTVVETTVAVTPAAAAMAKCLTLAQLEELERTILEAQAKEKA
jgi:hypothetical protein